MIDAVQLSGARAARDFGTLLRQSIVKKVRSLPPLSLQHRRMRWLTVGRASI